MTTLPLIIKHLVYTHARLRLVCEAFELRPEAVRLDSLSDAEQARLLQLGEADWIAWLNQETPDTPEEA